MISQNMAARIAAEIKTSIDQTDAPILGVCIGHKSSPWVVRDRAWFARHPDRKFHLRPAFNTERPDLPPNSIACVQDMGDGLRLKRFAHIGKGSAPEFASRGFGDAELSLLWNDLHPALIICLGVTPMPPMPEVQ